MSGVVEGRKHNEQRWESESLDNAYKNGIVGRLTRKNCRLSNQPYLQTPVNADCPILTDNDRWLAADKPAGLATIAEADPLIPHLHGLLEKRCKARLWIVHRLDKEVSGVVLFARTAEAHRQLCRLFAERRLEKIYEAIVLGRVDADGFIDRPLREFGSGRVAVDPRRGKPSLTRYSIIRRAEAATWLEVRPATGRRHQIRAHLYSIGHPLAGDPRYGSAPGPAGFARLLLHARSLCGGEGDWRVDASAHLPESFLEVARRWDWRPPLLMQ